MNPMMVDGRMESLVAAAIAAPSADNRHVFALHLDADRLQLRATPDFLHAASNRRILGLLSIGAVVENLMLRGLRLGLRLEPNWQPSDADRSLLVEFDCRQTVPVDDALESAIETRHTNRRLRYTGPLLAQGARDQLSGEASSVDSTQLVWLDTPAKRQQALRLVRWAETERFRNQALHRELFESIRFDVGWRASAYEGLPPGSLELPWFERPSFSLLRHWRAQRIANLFGAHRLIGMRAGDLPCRLAPHLCAISAVGDTDAAALQAGRLLQRVWLRATTLDLALQVFAASPLYALDDSNDVSPELRRRLADGWKELCPQGRALMVFRLGRARPVSVRSARPAVGRFWTSPTEPEKI